MVYTLSVTSHRKDETPLYTVTNDSGIIVGDVTFSNACQWISNLIKFDDVIVRNDDILSATQWKIEDAAVCAWDSGQMKLYNELSELAKRA